LALVDALSNCRAEQLEDETIPRAALMLSDIADGLEAEVERVAKAMEEGRGEPAMARGRLGESEKRWGPNEHGKALMSCRRFPY
jgi:hypothetical protein